MSWRRIRPYVALALLAVAGVMLWSSVGRLRAALDAELPGDLPADASAARSTAGEPPAAGVAIELVAEGLERPLFVTHAGDGSGRLFVVEQGGRILVARDGRLLDAPFLDLSARLDSSGGERGLLGLAFAPDYLQSGLFYVAHTARGPVVRIARYRVSADPDRADPEPVATLLDMDDPASNHNGGMIAFGADGKLWIGTGDGGSAGDPWDNARDPDSLLGKILRLDVSGERYAIPPDNPFAGGGGRAEVWALGLRNPWRFSFDRATGELWIGDVGQGSWEEIDVEDPKSGGGRHYGWKTMEGRHCFAPKRGCDSTGLEMPVHEYGHDVGCSVTGGYVYRGRALPDLAGMYLFSDYCTGTLWALRRRDDGVAEVSTLLQTGLHVSSFGEDEAGEIYLCDHLGGAIRRLVPAARAAS
ncbi:MAG: PQQ-dependent sugar dehydrogenase [Holophagales bacterium]|nr:PQQ-dependent sugar dehydrogenase [Holophagales bacterium]